MPLEKPVVDSISIVLPCQQRSLTTSQKWNEFISASSSETSASRERSSAQQSKSETSVLNSRVRLWLSRRIVKYELRHTIFPIFPILWFFRLWDYGSPVHTLNDSPICRLYDSSDYTILPIMRLWLSNAHSKRFSDFQVMRFFRLYDSSDFLNCA